MYRQPNTPSVSGVQQKASIRHQLHDSLLCNKATHSKGIEPTQKLITQKLYDVLGIAHLWWMRSFLVTLCSET